MLCFTYLQLLLYILYWVCKISRHLIKITIWPAAIFQLHGGAVFAKRKMCVSKYHFNSTDAELSWLIHHISKDLRFQNETNDAKLVIPSDVTNHITIAISDQIIAVRYFFKIVQPCFVPYFINYTTSWPCKK